MGQGIVSRVDDVNSMKYRDMFYENQMIIGHYQVVQQINPTENLQGEQNIRPSRKCIKDWSKIPVHSGLGICYKRRLKAVLIAKVGCKKINSKVAKCHWISPD